MKIKNLLWFIMFLPLTTFAQDALVEAGEYVEYSKWSSQEIVLIIGILLFTVFIVIVEAVLIIKSSANWAPDSILKIVGLTLILCFSILLLAAQYSQDQTAPIFGLFGVIAGYLLGHESKK